MRWGSHRSRLYDVYLATIAIGPYSIYGVRVLKDFLVPEPVPWPSWFVGRIPTRITNWLKCHYLYITAVRIIAFFLLVAHQLFGPDFIDMPAFGTAVASPFARKTGGKL
jgi:hypothetical protein